jgi:ATP-dependent protease Clp ATPase subunit
MRPATDPFGSTDGPQSAGHREAALRMAIPPVECKIGARGLRTTVEEIRREVVCEIPSLEGGRKCVVNADVIDNRTRPLLNEQIVPDAETA